MTWGYPDSGAGGGAAPAVDSTVWVAEDGVNFVTESNQASMAIGINAMDNGSVYCSHSTFVIDATGMHGTTLSSGLNFCHNDFGTLEADLAAAGQSAVVLQWEGTLADFWLAFGDGGRNAPWYTENSFNGITYESGVFPGSHRGKGLRAGTGTGFINSMTKTVAPTAVCIHFNGGGKWDGRITFSEKPFDYDLDPSDMEHTLGSVVSEGLEDWNGQANAMGQLLTQSATKHDRAFIWYRKGNLENAILKSLRWFTRTLDNQ